MSLIRDVFLFSGEGRWHTRISRNAPKSLVMRRLQELGVADMVAAYEEFDDVLRLNGGNYAIVKWHESATRAALIEALMNL